MEEFRPFSELTKDFTPERRARIEAIKARMREEDPLAAATPPQEHGSGDAAATARPGEALNDPAGTGR